MTISVPPGRSIEHPTDRLFDSQTDPPGYRLGHRPFHPHFSPSRKAGQVTESKEARFGSSAGMHTDRKGANSSPPRPSVPS